MRSLLTVRYPSLSSSSQRSRPPSYQWFRSIFNRCSYLCLRKSRVLLRVEATLSMLIRAVL